MRKLIWKIVLIVGLVSLFLWTVYPPQESIRLGKDLRGGVSLIYRVKIDDRDPDPDATLKQVIEVLQERVNPQGVLDIAMQPVGTDRIEIVMPLPNREVVELREAYENALGTLMRDAQITESDLLLALETGRAVDRFGGAGGERRVRIEAVQAAFDAHRAAVEALEQAQVTGADEAGLGELELAVADADIELDRTLRAVLDLSLDRARVERAVRLATEPTELRDSLGDLIVDPVTGEVQVGPSPREVELQSIGGEFPHLADALERLVAAYDEYAGKRKGFDDPEDLMRLLRGAGVLDFRIAVRASDTDSGVNAADMRRQLVERGTRTDSPVAAWFPINDLKQWYRTPEQLAGLQADPVSFFRAGGLDLVAAERDGEYYLLLYTTLPRSMTHRDRDWGVSGTAPSIDSFGREAVSVTLDAPGGREMNRLTGPNVGEPMAIVLDGEVYSAPRIQDVLSRRFQITGSFSPEEVSYLHRVLNAGSLQARLTPEPIAVNTLGPSIGKDNLSRGVRAFIWALIAVAVFMVGYYFFGGFVADLALLINGIMIFGFMAAIDGTFTLPGLAGIVLTIGMAVDANVLIYERIREEIFAGESELRGAIRLGYRKALSTILDANVTNLIICAVLYKTATTEVKGFALTLSIGICATLFTALFVTRVVYEVYTDVFGFRRLAMLPTTFPAIHRMLEPSINWIGLRRIFWSVSVVAVALSIGLVSVRGADMFDTEFRGGVAVTMQTAVVGGGGGEVEERIWLAHTGPDGVEQRVRSLADVLDPGAAVDAARREALLVALHGAGALSASVDELPPLDRWSTDQELSKLQAMLGELANAGVLTVGDTEIRDDRVHATQFQVKVSSPRGLTEEETTTDAIVAALVSEFGNELDVTRPMTFDGVGSGDYASYTVPVRRPSLGENIERPRFVNDVSRFVGGVAVILNDVEPPTTPQEVEKRIARMRAQPDFAAFAGRDVKVFGLEPADPADPEAGFVDLVAVVVDADLASPDVDPELWEREVAEVEWSLVSAALQRQTSLEQVSSFSSAVARTLQDNAIVAVGLSLLGILVYIWIRFGSLRYSAAAIVALVHDVSIALGLLALTAWAGVGPLSSLLLIEEFRIDLGVVAALLTIIGYSLNDTIVILDRIRENRGKLPTPTAAIVNRSINQTISRTVLTSLTTLLAVGIMYAAGGSGIRAFAFCLLIGLLVGTYSSVAIAAPLVLSGRASRAEADGLHAESAGPTGPSGERSVEQSAAATV